MSKKIQFTWVIKRSWRVDGAYRNEDNDGLLALNLNLLGGGDVQLTELSLQIRVDLQVQQSLRDGFLEVIGLLIVGFDNLGASGECHL